MKDDKLRYSAGVKTMQTKLNTAGYNCSTPDGKFGSGTDTAVRSFQRAKGLTGSSYFLFIQCFSPDNPYFSCGHPIHYWHSSFFVKRSVFISASGIITSNMEIITR